MEQNFALALPEIWLAAATMAALMLGVFKGDAWCRRIGILSMAILMVTLLLVWNGLPEGERGLAFGGQFVVDRFAVFAKILTLLAAIFSIWMSLDYSEREGVARFEFPLLLLLATLGMMLMISANDLIALYVGLELQSLPLYVVAAIRRDTLKSTEAGLKYFVLGALASGMLLYGASLIYGFVGTTSFAGLGQALEGVGQTPGIGLLVGLVFICAGLAFKISAVPFHMWTPDVYEGSPTPVTAFFAAAPKVAAIALFTRVLVGPFEDMAADWRQIVVAISVGSMLLGGFAAIAQRNIKRLLAYSSIGNVGYALVGLAAGTASGVSSLLFYMAIYVAMTLGAFAVVLGMRRKGSLVEEIEDLRGLARSQPWLAHVFAAILFSMAGIPPLAGFFGKLLVFNAAVDAGLFGLAVIGVVASVVSAYYYVRIVKVMYFDEPAGAFDDVEGPLKVVLAVSAAVVIFGILFINPLQSSAAIAASSLFAG
jgi:NADH-quinone oxidoreductase subunit N